MHVLFIPSWFADADRPAGGVFFQDQARALASRGFTVGIVYPEQRSLRRFRLRELVRSHFQFSEKYDSGVNTIRSHGWHLKPDVLSDRVWCRRSLSLVRRYIERYGRPDVIHAQGTLFGGVVARLAAERWRLPYVITEHSSAITRGLLTRNNAPLISPAVRSAAAVFAVSKPLASALTELSGGTKVGVLPNVVDTDFFRPPERPRAPEPFTFLSVATLTANKGMDVLLRAFAGAFRGTSVLLHVGGDGPIRTSLESEARRLGIGKQVTFWGYLNRESVRRRMWSANAFALASHTETFGVVLIEALATGIPVVATASGGPQAFVTSDRGILARVGDEMGISEALRQIYESWRQFDPVELSRCVREEFGSDAFAVRVRAIYDHVVATANSAADRSCS